MRDGAPRGDEAGAWLREHFADGSAPAIDITWDTSTTPDPGAYERLLNLLFAPQATPPGA